MYNTVVRDRRVKRFAISERSLAQPRHMVLFLRMHVRRVK